VGEHCVPDAELRVELAHTGRIGGGNEHAMRREHS